MAMMISKFHKLIQSKVVWTAFAILISVAFVGVYTGAKNSGSQQNNKAASSVVGRLYGEEVTLAEYNQAYRFTYVMYSMMAGRPLENTKEIDDIVRQSAWQRIATVMKAEEMGLSATPDQVVEMITSQPLFQNRQTGAYDATAYNGFVSGFLPRFGMNAKAFEIMMAENVMISKASSAAAQGALVTEDEVKKAFHLYNDKITVEYAAIPRSLAGTPDVTEEEAKAYFEKNQEEFRFPEKVIVKFSSFDVAAYTNAVTVTDEMLTQVYESNKERFVKPAAEGAAPDAAPEYKALEEVKEELTSEVKTMLARQEAFNAADAMVAALSDETVTFEKAAENAGVSIVDNMPAFGAAEFVNGIDPYAKFNQAAFALENTKTHYYSDPIVGRDSVYVIALIKKLDSWLPGFDLVKDDAIETAKIEAAKTAYTEKAASIHAEVETALKAETAFADAAAKCNLELRTSEPFSMSAPLEGDFSRELMTATARFDAGTLVDLIPTQDEVLIAYVSEKTAADEVQLAAERESISASIRNEKAGRMAQSWQESLLDEAGFEDLSKEPVSEES